MQLEYDFSAFHDEDRQADVYWQSPWPLCLDTPITLVHGAGDYRRTLRIGSLHSEADGTTWVWEAHYCAGATYRRIPPADLRRIRALALNDLRAAFYQRGDELYPRK